MIKKHCDRCDSIFKERRPMNVFEKFAASVTRSDYSYCITKTFADAETSKIDLCEKCLKEFENWLENTEVQDDSNYHNGDNMCDTGNDNLDKQG